MPSLEDAYATPEEKVELAAMRKETDEKRTREAKTVQRIYHMTATEEDWRSVVGQCLGAASVCWENMSGTGLFESERCSEIAKALVMRIETEIVLAQTKALRESYKDQVSQKVIEIMAEAEAQGKKPCPTCEGQIRETKGGVCQTCGKDWFADARTKPHSDSYQREGFKIPSEGPLFGISLPEETIRLARAEGSGKTFVNAEPITLVSEERFKTGTEPTEAPPQEYVCPAALCIAGKMYPCEQMSFMFNKTESHYGWPHSNKQAEALWTEG